MILSYNSIAFLLQPWTKNPYRYNKSIGNEIV